MLETLFGSAMAKAATVLAGLTITTGAAAGANVLPQVAQDKVASAIELVLPLDIPDSGDAAKADEAEVAEELPAAVEDEGTEAAEQEGAGETDNFGQSVSGDAKSGLPQEDGRAFGEKVSTSAPKAPQATTARPADTPTADANPGTSYRESAPTQETAPTADANPGTSYRESAPTTESEEAPSAGNNPGTSYRP